MALPVDLRFAAVHYSGFQDATCFPELQQWPTDTVEHRILTACLPGMSEAFRQELVNYAKRGGYALADDSARADVVLTLFFLKSYFEGKRLILPVEIEVRDRRNGKTSRYAFVSFGEYPYRSSGEKGVDNAYHYYGGLLAGLKRNFPARVMAMLFYPHPEEKN